MTGEKSEKKNVAYSPQMDSSESRKGGPDYTNEILFSPQRFGPCLVCGANGNGNQKKETSCGRERKGVEYDCLGKCKGIHERKRDTQPGWLTTRKK